jgi:Cd2+/Zn2+-exporting ATPase
VVGGEEILALCAACEAHSTHPIGQSVVAAARERGLMPPKAENVEEFAGHGIRARVGTDEILCGNEKLMKKFGVSLPNPEETPHTRVYLARNGNLLGYLLIGDTLKSDAPRAVSRLKKQGLATAILTGDGEGTAQAVGKAVGADEVHARLLPEEKLSALRKLREKYGPVMFVGDGINDAPVLAGADVGAAMGSGTDAAIEAADVVFMTAKAAAIPEALELAAQTKRIAWQNVAFALGIKLLVMILGIFGYASMWAAVFADSGVAMLCVLYAILPLYSKKYRQIER